MKSDPNPQFSPLCDLHHSPMRRVTHQGPASEDAQSFHRCERRDCCRVFRDGYGYSDFTDGQFDPARSSSRKCSTCGATLYLAEVNHVLKVETWECTRSECDYTEDVFSPASR